MSYSIVAISNSGGAPEQAYRKMQSAAACQERPLAELFKFEVPSLTVGTLDTLMTLSDDLGKTDSVVEATVRKIEKIAAELSDAAPELTVGGVPPKRYIQQFAWDSAKYPNRRPLPELVSLITAGSVAVEEELKQLTQSFGDKQAALQEHQRRKAGNLLTTDWNDVLNDRIMNNIEVIDSEYLKTVFVAVPANAAEGFAKNVYNMAGKAAGFGGPDWTQDPTKLGEPVQFGSNVDRHQKRGSPVVPGSLQKVHEDDDSILYAVTLLKGQYEAGYYENNEFQQGTKVDFVEEFTKECKEKRFICRDFTWDPSQASKSTIALEQLQVEVDGMNSALLRWAKNHYGDAFVAWMHIKVIRVFVESVLRYGLPVDFTAALYKGKPGKEVELTAALDKYLGKPKDDDDDFDDGEEDFHDFVLLKFDP